MHFRTVKIQIQIMKQQSSPSTQTNEAGKRAVIGASIFLAAAVAIANWIRKL